MNVLAGAFILIGSAIGLFAGLGLMRFDSPYARFHAAGKASPIAFLGIAIGASIEIGIAAAGLLLFTGIAMVITLPIAVHLLFRAVHRTSDGETLTVDELRDARSN